MSTGWWWWGKWLFFKREMKIIDLLHLHGSAKKGDLIRFYGISGEAAGVELTQRVKQNLTKTKRKMAYYVIHVRAFSRFRINCLTQGKKRIMGETC